MCADLFQATSYAPGSRDAAIGNDLLPRRDGVLEVDAQGEQCVVVPEIDDAVRFDGDSQHGEVATGAAVRRHRRGHPFR